MLLSISYSRKAILQWQSTIKPTPTHLHQKQVSQDDILVTITSHVLCFFLNFIWEGHNPLKVILEPNNDFNLLWKNTDTL